MCFFILHSNLEAFFLSKYHISKNIQKKQILSRVICHICDSRLQTNYNSHTQFLLISLFISLLSPQTPPASTSRCCPQPSPSFPTVKHPLGHCETTSLPPFYHDEALSPPAALAPSFSRCLHHPHSTLKEIIHTFSISIQFQIYANLFLRWKSWGSGVEVISRCNYIICFMF